MKMRLGQAIESVERIIMQTVGLKPEEVEALKTLHALAKKVNTPAPRKRVSTGGTAVCELIRDLLKAKNLQAAVDITDTEGSFTDDQIITVDEDQDGENVHIVLQYVRL